MTRSQRWALAASILAAVCVTLLPMLLGGAVEYDSMVAVTLVMTVAIIFTAAFAADNLTLFREAREAEFTPIIDIRLAEEYVRGESHLTLELRNIGRGIAAGVEATFWWAESDLVAWIPHRVEEVTELLKPGEKTLASVEHPHVLFAVRRHFHPNAPDVVLQIRYRDALKRNIEAFEVYEFGTDEETGKITLLRSPHPVPDKLRSLEAKQQLLDEIVDAAASELNLAQYGLTVTSKVGKGVMGVRVARGDQELWYAQTGIESAVYYFGDWLREAAPKLIDNVRVMDEEAVDATGESNDGDP